MSESKILKKLQDLREKVQKGPKFDDVNISDDIKRPIVREVIRTRVLKDFQEIKGDEFDPIIETDLNIKASLALGNLDLVAVDDGPFGNSITIEIIDGASSGEAVVTVRRKNIRIRIEDGVTDYDTVLASLQASNQASALVDSSLSGLGTDVVALSESKPLEGGK